MPPSGLHPTRIEDAILRAVARANWDDWLPCGFGNLRQRISEIDEAVGNESMASLIGAMAAMMAEGDLVMQKRDEGRPEFFDIHRQHDSVYTSSFFAHGNFELKLTHSARRRLTSGSNQDGESARSFETKKWDVFISHATEDKAYVEPLVEALQADGVRVWFDKISLEWGDDLRPALDRGLSNCRYGIVVFSKAFLRKKKWTEYELNSLFAREHAGMKLILPIWHEISREDLLQYSPAFADRLAKISTADSFADIVASLRSMLDGEPFGNVQKKPFVATATPLRRTARKRQKKHKAIDPEVVRLPSIASVPLEAGSLGLQALVQPNVDLTPTYGPVAIPDNFLLGGRNEWASLLEEAWPDVGWDLCCMRNQKSGGIDDIGKVFQTLKQMPHNFGLAAPFFRESWENATTADVHNNRTQLGTWDTEIHQLQVERDEYQRLCQEADNALKIANSVDAHDIQEEATRRKLRLAELQDTLKNVENKRAALDVKLQDQEAYVFRSQLLDFLHSSELAVNPRNLANALAGLPRMSWQRSTARCSDMAFNVPSFAYCIFELISEMWSHRSNDFEVAPIEFFRAEALKIPEKSCHFRDFIWNNWRDLRNAIAECWKAPSPANFPFVLTVAFLRQTKRQKDAVERILGDKEKLKAPVNT